MEDKGNQLGVFEDMCLKTASDMEQLHLQILLKADLKLNISCIYHVLLVKLI